MQGDSPRAATLLSGAEFNWSHRKATISRDVQLHVLKWGSLDSHPASSSGQTEGLIPTSSHLGI